MDDLLEQFRVHYRSGQKTSVASLRQPYNMLVLKVLGSRYRVYVNAEGRVVAQKQ